MELSYEGLVAVTPRSGITVIGIIRRRRRRQLRRAGRPGREGRRMGHIPVTGPQLEAAPGRVVAVGDDMVDANGQFHRAVNLAAGSPRLMTYLRQAVRVVPGSYFTLFPEQERRSRSDHAALLDAIGQGDAASARTIAETHVLDAGAALGDWMRANAVANGTPVTP